MSYCRLPYMIFPTKGGIRFSVETIIDNEMDVFLYKIFLTRRNEFIKKIKHGKELIMEYQNDEINGNNYEKVIDIHKRIGYSDKQIEEMLSYCIPDENSKNQAKKYKEWLLSKEDEIFKQIINEV